MTTTLVLGGARSGKSRYAEQLLSEHRDVHYVATGPVPTSDDHEWQQRVRVHQERRPESWATTETRDLALSLMRARGPVLIEDMPNWVAGLIDEIDAWDDHPRATQHIHDRTDELLVALTTIPYDVVVVSNETGMSVVPETASGRLFRDLIGTVNARIGSIAGRVHLVIAGRVLDLSQFPAVR